MRQAGPDMQGGKPQNRVSSPNGRWRVGVVGEHARRRGAGGVVGSQLLGAFAEEASAGLSVHASNQSVQALLLDAPRVSGGRRAIGRSRQRSARERPSAPRRAQEDGHGELSQEWANRGNQQPEGRMGCLAN
ncbi:hypothetical protein GCM10026982_61830 [Nocardiopsis aegyptia]